MPRWKSSLNPKTLLELCVEVCTATLPARGNLGEARLLPPALKTMILELSAARGLVDEAILRALLHPDTPTLNLGGGITVDDGMLRAVAAGRCRRLTALNLSASWGEKDAVTAAGLLELFPAVGANLRELHLRRCPAVDDAVVAKVAQCCPRLRALDVRDCREVGDISLFALGELEGLVSLNISGTKVSDPGMVALAKGGTLRELIVDNCPAVTDCGLKVALELCPNLIYMSFQGCSVSGSFTDVPHPKLRDISWTIS